jgi:hypothetical protein
MRKIFYELNRMQAKIHCKICPFYEEQHYHELSANKPWISGVKNKVDI